MRKKTPVVDVSKEDLIWLAGWLEGEGSFILFKEKTGFVTTRITAASKDQDVVETVARILGTKVWPLKMKGVDYYRIGIAGVAALVWMIRLLPHMHQRRSDKIKEIMSEVSSAQLREALQRTINRREDPIS